MTMLRRYVRFRGIAEVGQRPARADRDAIDPERTLPNGALDPFAVLRLPVTMSCPELSSAVADLQAQIDALLALADHVIE
jgi:hypothetical protein